ncbi:MAG TPA: hypothetical protein VD948_10515 [Rhodothermales bacterium]|nr:hypothetical protein [Rhodothermales bacterium]
MVLFPALPSDARAWVYPSTAPIPLLVQRTLLEGLDAFFTRWTSHGRPVAGSAVVLHGRFLVVAATLEGLISGCGIDKLDHAIRDLAARLGLVFATGLDVAYRDAEGTVQVVPRGVFRRLATEGTVGPNTSVFDIALTTVAELDAFERPVSASWHARLLPAPASTDA